MNCFQNVKYVVSCRKTAERYGVEVNHYGMALCPFHNDRHPSLYVADDHYHCFACREHGDVINFAAKLFGLPLYEAAQRLTAKEKIEQQLTQEQHKKQRLENRIAYNERGDRTKRAHNLIVRSADMESIAPLTKLLTRAEFYAFAESEILTKYAQDHGYTNLKILVDDGYTGTNFQRPGVQEGFELVKQGLVGCWLCKDLSRFGRDYLTVGQYTDIIFPSYDVRFIAVNDGVDSQRGDGEGFAAVRNLFNEWYPRDTSKKVRISLHQRGTSVLSHSLSV